MVTCGKKIFQQIESKALSITIHWIQGHLDKVDAKKWFPPLWFALNHAADFFADLAAKRVELPRHITDAVQNSCVLVSKVQRRLVKILCSIPKLPRAFVEPKPKKERPKYLSLDEEAVQSRHRLTFDAEGKGWRCSNCQSFGKKGCADNTTMVAVLLHVSAIGCRWASADPS